METAATTSSEPVRRAPAAQVPPFTIRKLSELMGGRDHRHRPVAADR